MTMNETYIASVSVLSGVAQDEAGLAALAGRVLAGTAEGRRDFSASLAFAPKANHPTLRRAPRLSRMAAEAAGMAWRGTGAKARDAETTGTIWTSGYGENTIFAKLSETMLQKQLKTMRVGETSYAVDNAPLGAVCLAGGFRGPSAMLLGGDPLEHAALWLEEKRASRVLCGAVEEITPDIRAAFGAVGEESGRLSDGAAALLLTATPPAHGGTRITGFASARLPAPPYTNRLEDTDVAGEIGATLRRLTKGVPLDAILAAGLPDAAAGTIGAAFADVEARAVGTLAEKALILHPKAFFGESLGCSYLQSVALGAAMLRTAVGQNLPSPRCLLTTGLDVQGNYLAVRLEA